MDAASSMFVHLMLSHGPSHSVPQVNKPEQSCMSSLSMLSGGIPTVAASPVPVAVPFGSTGKGEIAIRLQFAHPGSWWLSCLSMLSCGVLRITEVQALADRNLSLAGSGWCSLVLPCPVAVPFGSTGQGEVLMQHHGSQARSLHPCCHVPIESKH